MKCIQLRKGQVNNPNAIIEVIRHTSMAGKKVRWQVTNCMGWYNIYNDGAFQ